eukprot:3690492-Lingulodinium_polyedra.AAC.1
MKAAGDQLLLTQAVARRRRARLAAVRWAKREGLRELRLLRQRAPGGAPPLQEELGAPEVDALLVEEKRRLETCEVD